MSLPNALTDLLAREAIQDALFRCTRGLDTNDFPLFESSLTPDAVMDLNGKLLTGLDGIKTGCYDLIETLDTLHTISNVRVEVGDEATTAVMTCNAVAMHYRAGEGPKGDSPRLLSGCLYELDLVKDADGGLWRIKVWRLKIVWAEGDWSVVQTTS